MMMSTFGRHAIPAAASAVIVVASLSATPVAAGQSPPVVPQARSTTGVTIYPILAAIPIFGAKIDVPPSEGGAPGASGSTDVSVNGGYVYGAIIETPRWLVDLNGLWTNVEANRSLPLTNLNSNITFFNVMAGVRVAKRLFVVAGVRRIGVDLDLSLSVPSSTSTLQGRANPVAWDPMIGVATHGRLTARTRYDLVFKGGGFGVGTDVDVSLEGAIDWDIWRRLVLRVGYSFVYYRWTIDDADIDAVQRTLVSKQTLHGPEFGIGIRF